MTAFEVVMVDGRVQRVEAEECQRQGGHWAFLVTQLVMNRPRSVVRLRTPVVEVLEIRPGPAG